MATLSAADRKQIKDDMSRENSNLREDYQLTKADFQGLVDNIDKWIEDNTAAFNTQLPEPSKTVLTAKQKRRLFLAVAKRRWEV